MSIYPDKKGGELTGRFAVAVSHKGVRLRDRCDTLAEAKLREAEMLAQLKAGVPVKAPKARPELPVNDADVTGVMFSEARGQAHGVSFLWRNLVSEKPNLINLRIIEELMGDCPVDAVDDDFVETLKDKLVDVRGISEHTVNRFLASLSKFLQWCRKRKWRTIPLPEITWNDEDGHRIRWFDLAEEARIYAVEDAKGRVCDEVYEKLVRIAIRTGMRRGELLGLNPIRNLRPGWVDLWETKSGRHRAIPMTPEDHKDLLWLLDGRMPTKRQLRDWWVRLRAAMGLEADKDFVFHACRHTCATRMALGINKAGRKIDPVSIKTWMGHADLSTTMRYVHMSSDVLENALDLMFGDAVEAAPVEAEKLTADMALAA